jgi:hypothetical protein
MEEASKEGKKEYFMAPTHQKKSELEGFDL